MVLRLRELRRARQLTLKQVGDHLNKSYATISRYEHGLIPITSTDLFKLADLYGVDVRDLWHEQETMPHGDC
jgi:transcriptional regulator with XRE-family HTH domain